MKTDSPCQLWPSLISADLLNLQTTIDQLAPYCTGWHLDVMDNHFVPNLTWGAQFVNAIAHASNKPVWVHLMIDRPEQLLQKLTVPEGAYITFHIETDADIPALIEQIKKRSWRVSIAVNPDTPIEKTFDYLASIDQILIMSVQPGFSGQIFIKDVLHKIKILKHELLTKKCSVTIAIDGGINRDNIVEVARLGVTQFGIAAGIFSTSHPAQELEYLNRLVSKL